EKLAMDLPAGPLDAAERERMILVDHALGHSRGGERQIVAFDDVAQQLRIGDAHRRRAEDRDRRLAAAINSAARASAASGAAASFSGFAGAASSSLVAASATSSGRSRCTGPFGSLRLSAIARLPVSPPH